MSEILTQLMYFTVSYVGLVGFLFFGLNFITKGFIMNYLRVRISKGAKLLIYIHSLTDSYYTLGKWQDKALKFKTRGSKSHKTITDIDREAIYSTMGVFAVEFDEENDSIINRTKTRERVYEDPSLTDGFIDRALQKPVLDKKQLIMLVLLGLCLLGVLIVGAISYNNSQNIELIINTLNQARVI